MTIPTERLTQAAKFFSLPGEITSVNQINNGNINQTYEVWMSDDVVRSHYVFQKINTYVFKHPLAMMQNISKITSHCADKLQQAGESTDGAMHFFSGHGGEFCFICDEEYWRVCEFVPNSVTYNACEDPAILRAAGCAFGRFQNMLADFDAALLTETIPNFHNTEARYQALDAHVAADPCGRVATVREELQMLDQMRSDALLLCRMQKDGALPLRVTHNDTKINNVLFDATTGQGKTVIDLDTVMPGLVAYDFGDAVRFAANRSAEDEKDLSLTGLDLDRFGAFAEGFVGELVTSLTENERKTLAHGVFVMTVELAVRFLDDYICGDPYFKLLYPEHNLVRTRCQLKLAKDVWAHLDEMNAMIERICVGSR